MSVLGCHGQMHLGDYFEALNKQLHVIGRWYKYLLLRRMFELRRRGGNCLAHRLPKVPLLSHSFFLSFLGLPLHRPIVPPYPGVSLYLASCLFRYPNDITDHHPGLG